MISAGCKSSDSEDTAQAEATPQKQSVLAKTGLPANVSRMGAQGISSSPEPSSLAFKPDVRAKRLYKYEKASVEVLGVCQVRENGVDCWNLDGKADPNLAKTVLDRIDEVAKGRPGVAIPLVYGHKNRLVVYRAEGKAYNFGVSLEAFYVPRVYTEAAPSQVDLPASKTGCSFLWAVEPNAKSETSLRFVVREPAKKNVLLDCRVGASGELAGTRYEITQISKQTDNLSWQIEIKAVAGEKHVDPSFKLLDKTDRTIGFADDKGNIISKEDYDKAMGAFQEASSKPGAEATALRPHVTSRVVLSSRELLTSESESPTLFVAVNPSQISKISISGSVRWSVEIAGLPLNRKG